MSFNIPLYGGGLVKETVDLINRVKADGGEMVDVGWANRCIVKAKQLGIYNDIAFWGDANIAVKKDGSGNVGALYDIGPNSNDATQATTASKPTLSEQNANFNSKNTLSFDGTDDYLETTGFGTLSQPLCQIVAGKLNSTSETHPFTDGTNSTDRCLVYFPAAESLAIFAGTNFFSGISNTNTNIISGLFNGVNSKIRVNQTETTGAANSNSMTGLRIGAYYNSGELLDGLSATTMVFSSDVSSNFSDLETLLNNYYSAF